MPLRFPENAPSGSIDQLESQLAGIAPPAAGPAPSAALRAAAPDMQASRAYRVYTVGLNDLEQGDLLAAASENHWRHLLLRGDEAVGEADLPADAAGAANRIIAFHSGPRAQGTLEGLRTADSLGSVQTNDYELRLLESPGIYLVALWLHRNGDDDLIIPVAPDRSGLERYRPYRPSEAAEVLQRRARNVRELQAANPGPSGA
jgi:hypothetical protein